MLLKVHGGTPKTASSLCLSCRKATIVNGRRQIIECGALSQEVALNKAQPVYQCSEYDDRSQASLSYMREIAWELKPDKKSHKLGFVQPDRKNMTLLNPLSGKEEW